MAALADEMSRDPLGEIGGNNIYAFGEGDPINSFDPFGLCVEQCGSSFASISFPYIQIKNPLSGTHARFCAWLAGKIRSYLSTTEDIRGWNNFVAGGASDIDLSDSEMSSVLGLAENFKSEIRDQARRCCRSKSGWSLSTTSIGDSIGAPWSASLGSVSITVKTECKNCTLTWTASIFDKYDFDPKWFSTHRSLDGELKTILVWAAQNASGCGWKEFHHKGSAMGFTGCNGYVVLD
jgi:hypothetical protein